MKENFDKSLEMLLHHEGGYVWDKRDPRGETMKGVPVQFMSNGWVVRSWTAR